MPAPSVETRSGRVLHVGCGQQTLPAWLAHFEEVRLDIDPGCEPDIVAGMTDMGDIGQFEAVYSSHALEHLYPHDVGVALGEFRRVLVTGGMALVFVPDLQDVPTDETVMYESPSGPITGLDMHYGKISYLAESPFMAHHTGFVATTLEKALTAAGFQDVKVQRVSGFNLFAAAHT